ncbi:unnamed protein product [Coregonus sp. 'balchen']|nr:unnamed protein product [Coregonus sp. 'balchen']
MSKTVGDTLIGVLDDLEEAELKRFKRKLCDRKQEPKVRKGNVEKADPVDLVDLLTRTFTEDGALNVAIEVLGAINCQNVAEELIEFKKYKHFVDHHRTALIDRVTHVEPILDRLLEKEIITVNAYSEQEPKVRKGIVEKADTVDLVDLLTRTFTDDGAVNVAIEELDKHFVDHHRTALIDRVTHVEPILDRLLERGIITTNTYSEVRAGKKKQKRMRELFDGPVKACGTKGKDIFLDILMDLEPWLISDLKGE